ncbi:MAG: hypothetical protein DMD25_10550 [Gemmatimonadetes bacterium]|nr:MAG: hypothetical protein DMD27_15845 [Gemmatimonadota bacterium]PYP76441.1 MAG: hypothetical protein DMD25_10550 [Gemmatimonadota bacterium]
MLMHRFGKLSAALTLGALATLPLAAQSPTDLADVCKVLGGAKLGQWASFNGTSGGSGGKIRLAVVGSERSGDSTLYWFEVSFAGKDPGKSGVVQILTGSLASGLESPRALVFKAGPQPAMKISGEMVGMVGKQGRDNTTAFDWAGRCSGAHVVGWESVTVPAGTFRALHVTTDDGGEVWASREVPFGLVKTHGKQGDLALTGRGTDAKSSITETPLEMPALPMPKN